MAIKSKAKGKKNELAFVNLLKAAGYPSARRGQQFQGTEESPDVLCSELPIIHFEIKSGARPNPWLALKQCANDKGQNQLSVVGVHKDREPWIICMTAEDWFSLIKKADLSIPVDSHPK